MKICKILLSVFSVAALLAATSTTFAETLGDGWERFSDNLIQSDAVDGYRDLQPGARRIGGLAVDRLNGDLYMCLNGWPFGAYLSKDGGETWVRFDKNGEVIGGWKRPYSINMDQDRSGRIAFFRNIPPPHRDYLKESDPMKQISTGWTVDGGETWMTNIPMPNQPYGARGPLHGMVHWQDEVPQRAIIHMISKHGTQVTYDGGETWTEIKEPDMLIEGSHAIDYARTHNEANPDDPMDYPDLRGYGISGSGVFFGDNDGIHFKADDAEEFAQVADFQVNGYTPIAISGVLVWAAENGLIYSSDGGASWQQLGSELPNVRQGPFFGKAPQEMVVVTEDGVFGTRDSGQNWTKVSDLFWVPDAYKKQFGQFLRRHDYDWDPHRNVLYVAALASHAYRKQLDW